VDLTFTELGDDVPRDPFADMIKAELLEIIKWADRQNPRAQQKLPGPSELGDPCDRRLGYRLADVPAVNTEFDPWAAIVGTAVHSWLESAFQAWMAGPGAPLWSTETELWIDDFVLGHSDLYSHEYRAVIDWKGVGPDVMKKFRKEGPPEGYKIQTHLYGYGYQRRGFPVERVVLACFPRAGWIKDMYVWADHYDPSIAEAALSRMYKIAQDLVSLDILKESHGHRWEQLPATPSNSCAWCPLYDPGRDLERGADATGCPGR
jgi:hypothetical protein